jgi:hypothetical protein
LVSETGIPFHIQRSFKMKKLIAVLMLASFAGVALPVAAQAPATPAPAATAPAAADKPAKSSKKQSGHPAASHPGKAGPPAFLFWRGYNRGNA